MGSLLLFPGSCCAQVSVCALQGSVSLVLCKFWQLYGGVNGDLLQRGFAIPRSAAPRVPAHVRPLLTHTSTGDTQTLKGRSGSVSVGSPSVHKVLFVPSKSLFPQSCVSSGGSVVGLMVTSSYKRAYAIPRSTAPRAHAPAADHC